MYCKLCTSVHCNVHALPHLQVMVVNATRVLCAFWDPNLDGTWSSCVCTILHVVHLLCGSTWATESSKRSLFSLLDAEILNVAFVCIITISPINSLIDELRMEKHTIWNGCLSNLPEMHRPQLKRGNLQINHWWLHDESFAFKKCFLFHLGLHEPCLR